MRNVAKSQTNKQSAGCWSGNSLATVLLPAAGLLFTGVKKMVTRIITRKEAYSYIRRVNPQIAAARVWDYVKRLQTESLWLFAPIA